MLGNAGTIICGGGFHPENCRLIWKLTSGSAGQPEGLELSFRVGAEDALEDVQRDHIAPSDMATWPPKFLPKTF
jgi:hypothetical protein